MIGLTKAERGYITERMDVVCNLHLVRSGRAQVVVGTQRFEAQEGNVFALFPHTYVRFEQQGEAPWHFYWLILKGARAREALALAGLSPDEPLLRGDLRPALEPIFQEIERLYAENRYDRVYPIVAAWRVVAQLTVHYDSHCAPAPDAPAQNSVAASARMLMRLEQGAPPSVEELAKQLSVSRSTLFRQFRDAYGESPSHYRETVQVERACRLLRETPSTLQEVAFFCGFATPQHFSRVFSRRMKMPPGQWRERQTVETE